MFFRKIRNATPKNFDTFDLGLSKPKNRLCCIEFRFTQPDNDLIPGYMTELFPSVRNIADYLVQLRKNRTETQIRLIAIRDSSDVVSVVFSDGFLTGGRKVMTPLVSEAIKMASKKADLQCPKGYRFS